MNGPAFLSKSRAGEGEGMLIIWKLLEKLLVSLLMTVVISFAAFSMMTGRFPPRKADIFQAIRLGKQMFTESKEFNQANQSAEAQAAAGNTVSMEQMLRLQQLGLKRTQTTIDLMNILKKFPQGVPNRSLETKLRDISGHLDAAGTSMLEVQDALKGPAPVSH